MVRFIFRHASFAKKQGGMCWRSKVARSWRVAWSYVKINSNLWLEVTMGWIFSRRSRWIWRWSKMEFGCKSYDKFRDAHVDTRVKKGIKLNQDGLWWNLFQHESCASRRNDWFWYKNRLNPRSYATCRAKTRSGAEAAELLMTDRMDVRKLSRDTRCTRWDCVEYRRVHKFGHAHLVRPNQTTRRLRMDPKNCQRFLSELG